MKSDLAIFAARLRDYISICSEDSLYTEPSTDPVLQAHFDAEFNGMALVLFALQFSSNTAYRKFCEARNISPNSLTHWKQIPAVPTVAFKELEMTSLPPEQRTAMFHSSGTTAQRPSRHFHSLESLEIYETSLWPWFAQNVIPEFKSDLSRLNWLALTPTLQQAPHSSLVHMFETIRKKTGGPESAFLGSVAPDGSWTLNFDSVMARLLEAKESRRPLLLLGTAFSFVHLVDHLAEKNLRIELPSGSRAMETGGYKGRSRSLPKTELHARITERLGIPASQIVCEYGMSELSSQAYDRPMDGTAGQNSAARIFRFPPWARAQIISPETRREVAEGETGLIRVFDLANVFSVVAVQTEDLGIRRAEGFELIGRSEAVEARGCSLMSGDS